MDELYANNPIKVDENEVTFKEIEDRSSQPFKAIICPWC